MNLIRQPRRRPEQSPDDPVLRFSRGEVSRQRAMRDLGDISYGELLERLAKRRLPLPRLPQEQEDAMVERLEELLAGR